MIAHINRKLPDNLVHSVHCSNRLKSAAGIVGQIDRKSFSIVASVLRRPKNCVNYHAFLSQILHKLVVTVLIHERASLWRISY